MRCQLITSSRTSCLVLCVSTRFVLACVFLQPQTRNQEVKGSNTTVLTHRARSVSFRCTHTLQAASQVASHDLKSSAESSAGTSEPDLNLSSSRSAAALCEINLWVGGRRFAFPQQPDALLECPRARRQCLVKLPLPVLTLNVRAAVTDLLLNLFSLSATLGNENHIRGQHRCKEGLQGFSCFTVDLWRLHSGYFEYVLHYLSETCISGFSLNGFHKIPTWQRQVKESLSVLYSVSGVELSFKIEDHLNFPSGRLFSRWHLVNFPFNV